MKEILTVTQLNQEIKNILEGSFSFIWVEGEISNLRRPQSGHAYFTLKDEKSQIRAVVFRSPWGMRNGPSVFELEEGMSIICRSRISVYQPRGEYQLIIDAVEPKGVGALQKAFEQLKERLSKEGLFEDKYKKRIPFLPQCIGLITSPTGAAIRDILSITARRCSTVNILIAPVRVQGYEACGEIVQAIELMNAQESVDVIILARGGGSLEDLAPFNDERLARKIFSSRIPIISAVGHETDFTIADFVADLRTPTPSAAAEMVVPIRQELSGVLESYRSRLMRAERTAMEKRMERVLMLEDRLTDPAAMMHSFRLHLSQCIERLHRSVMHVQKSSRNRLAALERHIKFLSPVSLIAAQRLALETKKKYLASAAKNYLASMGGRVSVMSSLLDSLSPLANLRRGYSIARTIPEGLIVRSADDVSVGGQVAVQVSSGSFEAVVTQVQKE